MFEKLSHEAIRSGGEYLSYGKYFDQYLTIDNRLITVRPVKLFDQGLRAQQDRANGRLYNNLPLSSYSGVFIDHSLTNKGQRNTTLVYEEGREHQIGVYKGMTKLPGVWGAIREDLLLSDTKDKASYEVINSQGINFSNPTTSFWMELAL